MSELPSGWVKGSLGDLGTWVGGGTPSKRVPSYWVGEIPWVSPKDMKVERIRDTIDHISVKAVSESTTNLVAEGTVLVVTRSGILSHSLPVAVTDREVALNQDIKACVPATGVESAYVAWALRSAARDILHDCSKAGTTVANIDTSRLVSFRIPVAPTNEQRRIVAAIEEQLSRLDAARALLEGAAKRLGTLSDIDVEGLRGWETRPLSSICPIFVDCPHRTPQYSSEGIPALRPRDVVGGKLRLDTAARVGRSEFELQTSRRIPEEGDVVYSRELSLGWAVTVPKATELCLSQGMVLFRPDDSMLAEFLVLILNSSFGRRQAEAAATGSAHPHVNLRDIRAFEIPAPPLDEQRRIVAQAGVRLSAIDALRAAIERAQRRSASLRRAVLERAFRGELVPQDPSDESAAVLLERIQAEPAATPPTPRRRGRATA